MKPIAGLQEDSLFEALVANGATQVGAEFAGVMAVGLSTSEIATSLHFCSVELVPSLVNAGTGVPLFVNRIAVVGIPELPLGEGIVVATVRLTCDVFGTVAIECRDVRFMGVRSDCQLSYANAIADYLREHRNGSLGERPSPQEVVNALLAESRTFDVSRIEVTESAQLLQV